MKFETLQFKLDGAIGTLTISRPQALNALNAQLLKELSDFVGSINSFPDMRALIITGSGEKAFVAGADIKEMQARDPKTGQQMAAEGQRIFQALEDLKIPTIAAVNGFALGGGLELALSCDFIVASKNAKMGLPEVSLGLIPGYGGTQRLARVAGKNVARLMTLTGDIYTAEQCEKWGLVAMITEPVDLMPTALKLAQKISERSPRAIALAKESISRGLDVTQKNGMSIEAELFHAAFNSQDRTEGVTAFVEKRAPKFTGK
jgi:enoyl-CoA hydratase